MAFSSAWRTSSVQGMPRRAASASHRWNSSGVAVIRRRGLAWAPETFVRLLMRAAWSGYPLQSSALGETPERHPHAHPSPP